MNKNNYDRYHWSKTTYELRLKSLWKNSERWVKNNPLPPASVLFKPLASSISVTRTSIIPRVASSTTTAASNAITTTTTQSRSTTQTAHANCQSCTCSASLPRPSTPTIIIDTPASTESSPTSIQATTTKKLSRIKKQKLRHYAERSKDSTVEKLSRRQAKAARKVERELMAQASNQQQVNDQTN